MGWRYHDLDPRLQKRIAEAEAKDKVLDAVFTPLLGSGPTYPDNGGSQRAASAQLEVGKDGIQAQIRKWCDSQWPKWKVIQARSDQRSTIALGAQDCTIFAPGSRVFCIEVKAKGKKLRPEQMAWKVEMEMLGHTVQVVHSLEEFLELVKESPCKSTS